MNKNKSLKELGEEYFTYIKLNDENIALCRKKLNDAKNKGDSLAVMELKRTLLVLYEVSRELKANSKHIIEYYNKTPQKGKRS